MATIQQLNLPVGYRFDPVDAEVVVYLKNRILCQELPSNAISITHTDPYSQTPDQLPLVECEYFNKNEWFFFATRPSCDLMSCELITCDGFYKCLNEEMILDGTDSVGYKRKYNFFRGMPPKATEWVIYEYRLKPDALPTTQTDEFTSSKISTLVICKVVRKRSKKSSSVTKQSAA